MAGSIDRTIDRLSAELRVLDRQNAWLESMIENWDYLNISTPRTRPRRHRSPSLSPPRDRLGAMLDAIELSAELIPTDDEEEDEQDIDEGYESDASAAETIVYHTETWGHHPRGIDRGSNWWDTDSGYESDSETVVGEWEDPHITPVRWTSEHAAYFMGDSPGF